MPWAALLRRVLDVDALACPECNAPIVVLAFLTDPAVVRRILTHRGLPAKPIEFAPAICPFDEPAAFPEPDIAPPSFDETATALFPNSPRAPP